MTTLREAAQQALEAMEQRDNATLWHQAIHALRDALAQEEQEPVAWLLTGGTDVYLASEFSPGSEHEHEWTPLFTHPARREWQSLSDEEIKTAVEASADFWAKSRGWITSAARAVERALKEKNQ
jgi:hypothetical protein